MEERRIKEGYFKNAKLRLKNDFRNEKGQVERNGIKLKVEEAEEG